MRINHIGARVNRFLPPILLTSLAIVVVLFGAGCSPSGDTIVAWEADGLPTIE